VFLHQAVILHLVSKHLASLHNNDVPPLSINSSRQSARFKEHVSSVITSSAALHQLRQSYSNLFNSTTQRSMSPLYAGRSGQFRHAAAAAAASVGIIFLGGVAYTAGDFPRRLMDLIISSLGTVQWVLSMLMCRLPRQNAIFAKLCE
jgi:hypothetical protein